MKKISAVLLLVFTCCGSILVAQNEAAMDAVELKDGSRLMGQLLETKSGEFIRFETDFNGIMFIELDDIKAIYPSYGTNALEATGQFEFSFEGSVLANENHLGPALLIAVHQQVLTYLSIGLGTGVNVYDFEGEQINFPLYVSTKLYLSTSDTKAFIDMNLGYSWTSTNEGIGMTDSNGGVMINPRFGLKFGKDVFKVSVFTGFKYQKSSYIYQGWGGEYEQKFRHQRIELGMGLHF